MTSSFTGSTKPSEIARTPTPWKALTNGIWGIALPLGFLPTIGRKSPTRHNRETRRGPRVKAVPQKETF